MNNSMWQISPFTDHSRTLQLNSSSKCTVNEDQTIMNADQQEALTEDEETLKQMLITSQYFLNAAQSLLQIQIPVNILQKNTENISQDKDARLFIDCGNELLRRKSNREVLSFYRKGSLTASERRRRSGSSIDVLIKEVNADIESLKYRNCTKESDYGLADWLNRTIENDVQNRRPDVNCLWDFGWDYNRFGCLEIDEMVRDVEKYVLNALVNELSKDLLNVSISIF